MRILLLAAALAVTAGAAAFPKTDLGSRARMHAARHGLVVTPATDGGKMKASARRGAGLSAQDSEVKAFVTLVPGADASVLEALGVKLEGGRGRMVLASFPDSLLETIEALPEVESIRTDSPVSAKMNIVREVTGIDRIHAGIDLPQAYTGKGVVAGIVDGGIDPNHVNFRKPDGTSRIGSFTFFRPTQSGDYVQQTFPADYIPEIDTETSETFHGTHTLGIMAGSYTGNVNVAVANTDGLTASAQEVANPYYGVATEADLAVACGAMSDYYVALGIEAILDYAYYEKSAPSVINLSLGNNLGAHDGSSALCQYLDQVSDLDRVIFCVAAGNEGELPIALHKTFTADDLSVATCLRPGVDVEGYQNMRYGQVYVYSDTEEQFELQAMVVNRSRGAVAMRMPMGATSGAMKYWVTSASYQESEDDVVSPQLAKWFTGYIGVGAEFDNATGRYYGIIDYMLWDNTTGNAEGNYVIGIQASGKEGQRVDFYGDGSFCDFTAYGMTGYADGMTDGTISDVACGHNTISVGAYNTRDSWAAMDGFVYTYPQPFPAGEISGYSSYGSLPDGRTLPEICAPGSTVISSTNEYYILENFLGDELRSAYLETDGRGYSWQQCIGTSMATPVVSGTIALWLEADPSLTYKEVKDILAETAVKDSYVLADNPARWGAGKLDAYAGLRKVLAQTGIAGVETDKESLVITPAGLRSFAVTLPGAQSLDLRLYSTSGVTVRTLRTAGAETVMDLTDVPSGIYLLNVNGSMTRKIVVK
ncbi:MAG: S8 family peptidase [Duncaniella sp.]|nr:S8 family peptidase [Duncaniella sp.]